MWIPLNLESYDCETCGPSYDELEVEFDGEWVGRLRVGCYGGDEYRGDRGGLVDWLRSECAYAVDPEEMRKAISALESA